MPVLYFLESRARCPGYTTAATRARRGRCRRTGHCGTAASGDTALRPGTPPRQRCACHTAGPSPPAAPVRPPLWKPFYSTHKNGQRGFFPQLVEGAFLSWFSLLCFLPRNNLLHFEWSSSWRFLSSEENLWRRRCSSLFLWQTLFCHRIWLNSMLWFWVVSRPSSLWRYLVFVVLLCQILETSSHLLSESAFEYKIKIQGLYTL